MAVPKRKQSKSRSRHRRGANQYTLPQLSKNADGTWSRSHYVDPRTGLYNGRQVLDIDQLN